MHFRLVILSIQDVLCIIAALEVNTSLISMFDHLTGYGGYNKTSFENGFKKRRMFHCDHQFPRQKRRDLWRGWQRNTLQTFTPSLVRQRIPSHDWEAQTGILELLPRRYTNAQTYFHIFTLSNIFA